MNREIEFRYWCKPSKQMSKPFTLQETTGKESWDNLIPLQYTGLKDKNGKKIFEGDILNKQYRNMEVYDGVGAVYMGCGSDSDGYIHGFWLGWKCGESSLRDVAGKSEVIGNVYENPELLEEKR